MRDTPVVALSNRAAKSQVLDAARALTRAASAGGEVELDLSGLAEIDTAWAAVLSNVLAGGLRDVRNLLVHMPQAHAANAQLARSGLHFALARHQGVQFEAGHGWDSALRPWRRDWQPANLQEPLFDLLGEHVGHAEPDPFADQLVAFLNPDRAPREDAPSDQSAVVYPWLRKLMGHQGSVDQAEEANLHRLISVMTWELLDNVREHAQLARKSQSSLATFATRGRPNRLHLCVMDTGVGIPQSLARRYPNTGDTVELFGSVLEGRVPLRGRSRGQGLHRIKSFVEDLANAQMFVASGPTPAGGAVMAERVKDGSVKVSEVPGLKMRGTVVMVTLPFGIARRARSTPDLGRGVACDAQSAFGDAVE